MGAEQSTEAAPPPADPASTDSPHQDAKSDVGPSALVICGPSGVGKGTLIRMLMEGNPGLYEFSVSHTTRAPRPGEQDGVHYHFTTREEFSALASSGGFLETAEVHGELYGTSHEALGQVLASGKVPLLDIDVQGARRVRASPTPALLVFVAPPSLQELERRLRRRATEDEVKLRQRLDAARSEIESLNEPGLFDYLLINDDVAAAAEQLADIGQRAAAGLPAEPGHVPERVILEEEGEEEDEEGATAATADGSRSGGGTPGSSSVLPGFNGGTPHSGEEMEAGGLLRWRGRVAMVTGASSGIGWATCDALAQAGMRVVAVARRRDRLEALQQHLVGGGVCRAGDFLPVVCDVTKEAEVQALPKIILKRWPDAGIDVLVNNAGLSRNNASLFSGSTSSWVEMLSTNILGTAMCTREAVQDMKRRGSWGHIINMVGLSGHRIPDGPSGGGFFAATKFAVRAMTEGLRQEARGAGVPLRVSGISPGLVETEFFSVRAFGDSVEAAKATAQLKALEPQDVARTILWCLSAPNHVEVNDIIVRPSEQLV